MTTPRSGRIGACLHTEDSLQETSMWCIIPGRGAGCCFWLAGMLATLSKLTMGFAGDAVGDSMR